MAELSGLMYNGVLFPFGEHVAIPTIDFLLIGGGGGGGGSINYDCPGGGGGAGGYIKCECAQLEKGTYSIVVGAGGGGSCEHGSDGCNSCFGEYIAYGGGGGGKAAYNNPGNNGGSGGGSGIHSSGGLGCCGQGNDGGGGNNRSGGGGGAGCEGGYDNFIGGIGKCDDITGSCVWYAGGGSGINKGIVCGANNCGGGGYGGCPYTPGGNGYCGLFVARYPSSCGYDITGGTCYTCGDYTIHCFTSDGTLTVN